MRLPHEIVIPYEVEYKYQYQQESNEPMFETAEDGHRYAMFVKGNNYLIDGRTYCFKDEEGNYVSTFVSQYSDIIQDNLEPGVKEAVLALHEKGYLTFTSCQGHADSKHRYIGVLFNTKEQKTKFIEEVNRLKCDTYWYDNVINSVERPCHNIPWWSEGGITLHIIWDNSETWHNAPQQRRRNKPYTDAELTKFWNVQTCRNYQHYEAIVISFGYPMVEKNIWQRLHKYFFYSQNKVENAYDDFTQKIKWLSEYLA